MDNDDLREEHWGCGICPSCCQCPSLWCTKRTEWPTLADFNADGYVVLRNYMDCPWISLIRIDGVLQWDYEGVFFD